MDGKEVPVPDLDFDSDLTGQSGEGRSHVNDGGKGVEGAGMKTVTVVNLNGEPILERVEIGPTEQVRKLMHMVADALGGHHRVHLFAPDAHELQADTCIGDAGLLNESVVTAVNPGPQPWENVTSALRKLLEGVWFDGSASDVSQRMWFDEGELDPQAASADDTATVPVNKYTSASREFPAGRTCDALDPQRAELERLARAQIRVRGEQRRFLVGPFRDILSYRPGNTSPYWAGKDADEIVAIQAQLAELAERQQGLELMWASGDEDSCQYDHGFCLINHDGRWIKFYNTDLIWA